MTRLLCHPPRDLDRMFRRKLIKKKAARRPPIFF
jgi:hypothetical protein